MSNATLKSRFLYQFFVMDETPYFDVVRRSLRRGRVSEDERPLLLIQYSNLFFTRALVHFLFPALFAATIVWNLARHG
jgi:hypothetical protein